MHRFGGYRPRNAWFRRRRYGLVASHRSIRGRLTASSVTVGVPVGAILEIRNLTKSYGSSAPAVDNVSLTVNKGEFLCIIGPSGCGKSTLLRMIGGFVEPTSGDIRLDGQTILKLPPYRRPV